MADLLKALEMILDPSVLIIMLIAMLYGGFVGSMPGLTATMATALFVPFAFFMDPLPALAAIASLAAFAIFSGDIPAALVRIPGTPSSAAYSSDLYLLTKNNQGGVALGICVLCSSIGSFVGTIMVIFASSILSEFAMNFTSFEYFWLAILGLGAGVVITQDSPLKGTLAMSFGLLLSTIGIDVTLGFSRFNFGSVNLLNGVSFIPAMIGLFGFSEVIRNTLEPDLNVTSGNISTKKMFSLALTQIRKYWKHVLRSSPIGTIVGALPGAGADIASWIAYGLSKNFSKEPEKYGKGSFEPLVAAASANNAAVAGAWVPALVFGIPGDTVTAILIGVMFMKGLRPGPQIFQEQTVLVYGVYIAFLIASLFLIPFGYLAVRYANMVFRIRKNTLMPIILTFCIVGSYSINNSLFDVIVMLIMGIVGYIFEKNGINTAPVILAIILGPIVERNFMMSVMKTGWNFEQFFLRPISAVLLVCAILTWTWPLLKHINSRVLNNKRK